jgi:polyhydroxybutyrate depolymerase
MGFGPVLARRLALAAVVALTACGDDGVAGEDAATGGGEDAGASGRPGFATPEPTGCIDDVRAGAHRYTCDGLVYDARVPSTCLKEPCGLIFDVHGFSMSGEMEEANTNLADLGEEHGYVVFQPNAAGTPPIASWMPATDDDKVFAVLKLAMEVWHIDPDRVHFTGFSQGGAMTWRMLCKHADVFASVAPGAEAACFHDADVPSREVPILYLHGTADALVSFSGVAAPQRDRVVAAWNMDAGETIAGDEAYTRTRHTSAEGTVFELLQHDYQAKEGPCLIVVLGGHCFPGSTDPGGATGQACSFACVGDNAFHWGEEVMAFFRTHPRAK